MSEPVEQIPVRAQILVKGRVQGVGYRAFAAHVASRLGLRGWVKNLDDGNVALDVEGLRAGIDRLVEDLRVGPPASRVTGVDVEWGRATGRFSEFRISY